MNAKNIILAILMVLSFAACSSEIEGIDDTMPNTSANNANGNGTTSISVRMTTGDMNTKSGNQVELNINNYVIAVFEANSNERVGYATGTNPVTNTITNIDIKEGTVNVIVVANVDDVNDFDNLYTYDEFAFKTVGNLNNLTKVGISRNVLLSETKNELNVELKQLTARVNVTLNEPAVAITSGDNNITADFKAYSYLASIAETSMVISQPQTVNLTKNDLDPNGETSFSYYTYAVKNPTLEVNAKLEISVGGEVKKTINKVIDVHFISEGTLLEALIAGKSYNQQVNINVTVSQKFDVDFTYEIVEIVDNEEQEITYN